MIWDRPCKVEKKNTATANALLKALCNGLFIEGLVVGFFKEYYGY